MAIAKKRKRGNQTKLSPKRVERLLESIAAGNYLDASAQWAGVHVTTVRAWVNRGEDEIARASGEGADASMVISDWLDNFKDDFKADNPMWIIDPPEGFDPEEWQFALFAHRFEKARGIAEVGHVQNITTAARGGVWQASAWWLERTRPEKYGRKEVMALQGVEGGPAIQVQESSVEGLMERVSALMPKVIEAHDAEEEAPRNE